jgi:hypothetical protein
MPAKRCSDISGTHTIFVALSSTAACQARTLSSLWIVSIDGFVEMTTQLFRFALKKMIRLQQRNALPDWTALIFGFRHFIAHVLMNSVIYRESSLEEEEQPCDLLEGGMRLPIRLPLIRSAELVFLLPPRANFTKRRWLDGLFVITIEKVVEEIALLGICNLDPRARGRTQSELCEERAHLVERRM